MGLINEAVQVTGHVLLYDRVDYDAISSVMYWKASRNNY